jgi:hypothetical protein
MITETHRVQRHLVALTMNSFVQQMKVTLRQHTTDLVRSVSTYTLIL